MTAKTDVTTTQTDHLRKLANDKGIGRVRFQRWLDEEVAQVLEGLKPLLTLRTSIALEAMKRFVAADHFTILTSASAKVKIGWMSDTFKQNFLPKVEENIPATKLAVHRLEKNALDKDIREELGADYEETALAHLYQMLAKQGHGQAGPLLTNGYANIFYIKDANGELWAVYANWNSYDGYWNVSTDSVESPYEWRGGSQVVSQVVRT